MTGSRGARDTPHPGSVKTYINHLDDPSWPHV